LTPIPGLLTRVFNRSRATEFRLRTRFGRACGPSTAAVARPKGFRPREKGRCFFEAFYDRAPAVAETLCLPWSRGPKRPLDDRHQEWHGLVFIEQHRRQGFSHSQGVREPLNKPKFKRLRPSEGFRTCPSLVARPERTSMFADPVLGASELPPLRPCALG
jgi:hypothetical protein